MNSRYALAAAAGLFLLVLLVTAAFFDQIVLWAMSPAGPFDASAVPAPPDYARASAWSALPDRVDAADATVPALPASDQVRAPVDVFYIHPTTYVGPQWNARIDDDRLNADTDRVATRIQASAFNACCAVYAPRYRQANGTAFTHPSDDGQRAVEVAFRDVVTAFRHFEKAWNRERPFIVAAHSQGSVLAHRLLREEISAHPSRARLVVAYLVGAPWPVAELAAETPDIVPCASADQTGCVVSYNARRPRFVPNIFDLRLPATPEVSAPGHPLCVNPLNWRLDDTAASARENEGAVFLDADAPALLTAFADAQCRDGTLVVRELGNPPRDFPSRLLDRALGPGNYHPIEYQLFFANLRSNAKVRAGAFSSARGDP